LPYLCIKIVEVSKFAAKVRFEGCKSKKTSLMKLQVYASILFCKVQSIGAQPLSFGEAGVRFCFTA
jgi:hypothetical protein